MPKRKTRKKKTTKKGKSSPKNTSNKSKSADEVSTTKQKEEIIEDSDHDQIIETEVITTNKSGEHIEILELKNENSELKATIEKAKKKLRIMKMKLDLAEEKEEQWRVACYNIADVFAEKSQVSLDDVLKKFEAPVDDTITI